MSKWGLRKIVHWWKRKKGTGGAKISFGRQLRKKLKNNSIIVENAAGEAVYLIVRNKEQADYLYDYELGDNGLGFPGWTEKNVFIGR